MLQILAALVTICYNSAVEQESHSFSGIERGNLNRAADVVRNSRQLEAAHAHHAYALYAYDRRRNTASIRFGDASSKNPIYHVHLGTHACDCPDARARVRTLYRRLAAAGLSPTLTCKHPLIMAFKLAADSELLFRVPVRNPPAQPRITVTTRKLTIRRVRAIGRSELMRVHTQRPRPVL